MRTSAEEAGLSSALASQIHGSRSERRGLTIRTYRNDYVVIRWHGSAFEHHAGSDLRCSPLLLALQWVYTASWRIW